MMLETKRIEYIFQDCLYKESDQGSWVDAVGVSIEARFEPVRLSTYKSEIAVLLKMLPKEFEHTHLDHGASFQSMLFQRDGYRRWTNDEEVADKLLCLALALKLAYYLLIREYWPLSPDGAMVTFILG